MIVDSSALIAVLRNEPEAGGFSRLIRTRSSSISAATLVETSTVAGPDRQADLDAILVRTRTSVVSFDRSQSELARRAYLTYGKGSGSRARLNLGDCYSYALAKATGEPLLFKGDDFTHTDVASALEQEALGDQPDDGR